MLAGGKFIGGAGVDVGDNIPFSARFDDTRVCTMGRAHGPSDDARIWGLSVWFKPMANGVTMVFLGAMDNAITDYDVCYIAGYRLEMNYRGGGSESHLLSTMRMFRDPSAWYHVFFLHNSPDATSGDRQQIWVNGIRVTDFNAEIYSIQNQTGLINYGAGDRIHTTGAYAYAPYTAAPSHGYMAEMHFIDGTVKAATDFGRFSADTGEWVPKTYTGAHGAQGFYRSFADAGNFGVDQAVQSGTLTFNQAALWADEVSNFTMTNFAGITSATVNKAMRAETSYNITGDFELQWTRASAASAGAHYAVGIYDTTEDATYDSNQQDGSLDLMTNSWWVKAGGDVGYGGANQATVSHVDGDNMAIRRSGSALTLYKNGASAHAWMQTFSGTLRLAVGNGITGEILRNFALSTGLGARVGNSFSDTGFITTDQVPDTPTENYCTFNPLSNNPALSVLTTGYSEGNLQVTCDATRNGIGMGTMDMPAGKWYFEFTAVTVSNGVDLGIGNSASDNSILYRLYRSNGQKENEVVSATYGNAASFASGDKIGIAVDMDNGAIWCHKNGTWIDGDGSDSSATVLAEIEAGITTSAMYADLISAQVFDYTWLPMAWCNNTVSAASINCGQFSFGTAAPSGFMALKQSNLPDPAIVKAGKYFKAIGYTGTGAELAITGVGFQPDITWIKNRIAADSHVNYDSIRGATKKLSLDVSGAEGTEIEGLKSFDTDGFTVGTNVAHNTSTESYASWSWKQGVRPGVDIVTYTGTGTNRAIAHGLGVIPELMIVKIRSTTDDWGVYHHGTAADPETDYLRLSTNAALADDNTIWNDTAPTASVFSLGTDGLVNGGSGSPTYVAYLFASVPGFSKIGRYIGNADVDGTFVYCGFRPAFVLIKDRSTIRSWRLENAASAPYNPSARHFHPDLNLPEYDGNEDIDFLSNGFKLRTVDVGKNGSGLVYVYAAFAEAPFKYARAR